LDDPCNTAAWPQTVCRPARMRRDWRKTRLFIGIIAAVKLLSD
jgi:hypothetical protein